MFDSEPRSPIRDGGYSEEWWIDPFVTWKMQPAVNPLHPQTWLCPENLSSCDYGMLVEIPCSLFDNAMVGVTNNAIKYSWSCRDVRGNLVKRKILLGGSLKIFYKTLRGGVWFREGFAKNRLKEIRNVIWKYVYSRVSQKERNYVEKYGDGFF